MLCKDIKETVFQGIGTITFIKTNREQEAVSPAAAIEITALSQIILTDREHGRAHRSSLQ